MFDKINADNFNCQVVWCAKNKLINIINQLKICDFLFYVKNFD